MLGSPKSDVKRKFLKRNDIHSLNVKAIHKLGFLQSHEKKYISTNLSYIRKIKLYVRSGKLSWHFSLGTTISLSFLRTQWKQEINEQQYRQ